MLYMPFVGYAWIERGRWFDMSLRYTLARLMESMGGFSRATAIYGI